MSATLTRSDALRALIWPMGILLAATVGLTSAGAPQWMLVVFAALFVVSVVLYFIVYIYFAVHDRDALRSETCTLHKMAIEHGIYGDSRTGLIDATPNEPSGVRLIPGADDDRPSAARAEDQ